MDARRREVEHLESEIRRLEHQITAECVETGRRLAALDAAGIRNEELLKYLSSIQALRRTSEAFGADIDRIRNLNRQIDARGQEIGENRRRADQLLREREAHLVEIGAGAFTVFRGLPEREAWRSYFEEILKLDLELEHRHDELKTLRAEEQKGWFVKAKLIPRKMGLSSEINRLEREKTTAYQLAGEKIADTEFLRLTEGPLRQLFEAAQERKRTAEGLAGENDRKVEEIEACRLELKRLEVQDRPDDRIRELERRIDGMHKELDVMFCWAGQIYLERDLRQELADAGLAAKFEIVAGLRESIRKKRQHADRLKAEMEIEEIQRREREKRARRKQLEEEMRVKDRQIGVIDIEINMGLRRIEELKRVMTGEALYQDAPPLPPVPELYPPTPGDGK
jgi:hypothetical protein